MKNILLIVGILISTFAKAQVSLDYYLPKNVSYDKAIPTPEEFLGYQVGFQHASPYEIAAYCKKIASISPRIKIESYARSYEKRELLLLTFTSPKNLTDLEKIKTDHQKLASPEVSKNLNFEKMQGVTWLGYSVHGNEASGTNSALLTVYYLAAAQGPSIDSLLSENIILVDPCINPDGGTRFSSWVNSNKSQNLVSDINAREFKETWPGGRTNHYWFDMNRDWLYQQLPESKGRLVKFYEWLPNILTDHHEMGSNSSFFFQPGIPARMHPLTPAKNLELTSKIGTYHAAGLDAIGSHYYTKENYDDFYYGKGSTLPDVNGSIGILFEQASSRGHLQETSNGLLSFPFTIRNQFTATLSTLKAAKNMRKELLQYMAGFYAESPTDDIKSYIFGGGSDQVSSSEMLNILLRNKVEVFELKKDETVNGQKFNQSNSYIVPATQPKHRLVKSFFEKRSTFQDSAFYDISAWTLPLCMNVPYAESKATLPVGAKITSKDYVAGKVIGTSTYAYAFEWSGYFAPRTAQKLLQKGCKLKYATEPFEAQTSQGIKSFSYGTVQFLVNDLFNLSDIQAIAAEDGTNFYGISTGLTPNGIDLGSEKFKSLEIPRPLMIVGEGIDPNDAGEIWHLLDQRYAIPLTFTDLNQISKIDLFKYTHLIMPSGRYADYISEDKAKAFLSKGGTIIAMGDANAWLSQKKLSTIVIKPDAIVNGKAKKAFDQKNTIEGALETSGAIVEANLDLSHPLCYGYTNATLPIFKVNNVIFEDTGNPYNTPFMFGEKPLMAGYIHAKNKERFKNSPAIIALTSNGGKIIHIADNPNFRAFWYGTNKIFANSLFFSNALSGTRFGEEE
jgi:Zinc carboxypeptidase